MSEDRVKKALLMACEFLTIMTSADGSGHADLARVALRESGMSEEEVTILVNKWIAERKW